MPAGAGAVRVDKVVTSGVFSLDGGDYDVDNNVWLVGDDTHVLVVDAAHDAGAILGAAAGALLGREIVGRRGGRSTGTILGAAGGGLAGRELTRDKRCR